MLLKIATSAFDIASSEAISQLIRMGKKADPQGSMYVFIQELLYNNQIAGGTLRPFVERLTDDSLSGPHSVAPTNKSDSLHFELDTKQFIVHFIPACCVYDIEDVDAVLPKAHDTEHETRYFCHFAFSAAFPLLPASKT
jgi:hypothetical protein